MSLVDQERIKLWALQKIIGPELERFDQVYDDLVRGDTPLINEVCDHVKKGKSKRFRPTLLLLSAKHEGGIDEAAITAAACVEMIHTATLLHDDFIDEALMRRGLASVTHHWGPSTALVMGDYLYSKALDCLIQAELHDAMKKLARTTVLMSQAEMMQIETKYDMTIRVEQYLKIIYRKTASLIESTCAIGAGLNPVLKDRAAVFGEFGGKTGFVFQITDDVFDYLGDERRLGKPTGQDWEEGRITLPLIAALENASAAESKTLLDGAESLAVDERKSYWPEIKAFVMKHGGVDAARDMARVYGEEAKQAITPVARGVQKDLLAVSVEYVLKRLN